jgi:hypothetical protein
MLDKENLLRVAEAVLATEQANERVTNAQTRLEAARATVETIRSEVAEAKEGVAATKASLDATVASIENTSMSKAAIIKAAEDLNRVFQSHGIGASEQASEEAEVEPELGRLTLKKLVERVADKIEAFTDGDADVFDRDAVVALLGDIQQTISEGAAPGKPAKDVEAPAKRKRRGKADAAVEASTEAASQEAVCEVAAEVAVDAGEVSVLEQVTTDDNSSEQVEAEDAANASQTTETVVRAAEIEEPVAIVEVAEVVVASDAADPDVVMIGEVIDVAEEPSVEAVDVADFVAVESPAEAVPAIDNSHVLDEVIELIDSNVEEDDLNSIVAAVAYAVFRKADEEQTALSLESYIALMSLDTVQAVSEAVYANHLAGQLDALVADPEYTNAVLAWFRNGIALIEDGKDFPAFAGIAGAAAAPVEDPAVIVEIGVVDLGTPAADEVFVADQDIADDAEAVEILEDISVVDEPEDIAGDEVAEVEAEAVEPVVVETTAPAPAEPVKPSPPPFMKPGFMKPNFMKDK